MACCSYGGFEDFANFYGNHDGQHPAIPWSNGGAQWMDGKIECSDCSAATTSISADQITTDPSYQIDSCEAQVISTTEVGKEVAISNIKNILRQKQPVMFTFVPSDSQLVKFEKFWAEKNEDAVWSFSSDDKSYLSEGHAVLCVGYDDTDPQNRYWIMVNSWPIEHPQYPDLNRPRNIFLVSMDMDYDCMYEPLQGEVPGQEPIRVNAYQWWTLTVQLQPQSASNSWGDGYEILTGPCDSIRNYAVPEWQDKTWIECHIRRMQ